jgi:Ca2+-binding RTX toxin-like protein
VNGGAGTDRLETNIGFAVDLEAGVATSFDATYALSNIEDVAVSLSGYASSVHGNDVANIISVLDYGDDGKIGVTFDGAGGDDTLLGSAGADLLYGSAGNDTLQGGAAADLLNGGAGEDLLRGDAGSDTADYTGAAAAVIVSLGTTGAQVTGGAGVDTLVSIENLTGSSFADRLTGTDYANTLSGNAGDDRLTGGGGNDRLDGGAGLDKMFGGFGNDTYIVRDATDYAYEYAGEGIDTVQSTVSLTLRSNIENLTLDGSSSIWGRGNDLANVITGNDGSNKLYGMDGDDRLLGGGGNDRIEGGAGIDRMYGGIGNDTYIVTDSTDYAYEYAGEGIDLVLASVGCTLRANVDRLTLTGTNAINGTGNADANVLTGNGAANVLSGLLGNDKIFAGGGDDALSGGDGADILDGGAGRDRFFGGEGSDRFMFDDGDFAGITTATCDQIKDFSQADGDRIRLDAVDADSGAAGDQAFGFIGSEAFSGTAGELRFEQISGNTYVQGDTDGDGTADFWIRLDGLHALTSSDFAF